jgi:menaquinone-dependent protoporphyrinogen oxidase
MKSLIVYGTRYGTTANTAEEIAKILRKEDFYVDILNLKEKRIDDISEYKLILVGTGIQSDKWVGEAEDFLKKFCGELAEKKVALFASSALFSLYKTEKTTEKIEQAQKKYLEQKAADYELKPIAMAIFGGVMDFDKMGFLARKTFGKLEPSFEAAGYKKTKPRAYDTRDWNEIKDWTRKIVLKARYL